MTTYKVVQKDGSHVVLGLPFYEYPETILIYRYSEGDIDTRMRDSEMMHGALYDLLQTHEGLQNGDRFETEYGEFVCRGIDVVKAEHEFDHACDSYR